MNIQILRDLGLQEARLEAGVVMIREGERSHEVYVLIDGEILVSSKGVELAKADAIGTIFGEISALLGTLPVATVSTLQPSTFYVIPEFMAFIRQHPEACVSVAQILACRLVNMNNHFVHIKEQLQVLQRNLDHYIPVFPENFQPADAHGAPPARPTPVQRG